MKFKMKIIDYFELSDGRTVFLGYISEDEGVISDCHCDLFRNGLYVQSFHVLREALIKKYEINDYRAIEVTGPVPFTHECVKNEVWEIAYNSKSSS
ncbi:hypothetical protein SOASR031_21680 [Leminorella grimontii]|nr:hypothetical protein SOASR031_21680 [Leminorella grimontii]